MTDIDRERDDAFWRAYESAMEDFPSADERYRGGYAAGFVDCAIQVITPLQPPVQRQHLRLVTS